MAATNKKNGTATVSLKDVARAAGVSVSTASQALNNYPTISDTTRRKVWAAKAQLGYEPNQHARGLRVNQGTNPGKRLASRNLALVIIDPFCDESFYLPMIQGFSSSAQERDMHPLVLTMPKPPANDWDMPAAFRNHELDGFLLAGELPPKTINVFAGAGLPFVMVGNEPKYPGRAVVQPDVGGATHEAMDRFFALGHRHIALLAARGDTRYHQEIIEAYRLAHSRRGLVPDANLERLGATIGAPTLEAVEALLALMPRPTAMLCTNPRLAVEAKRLAGIAGMSLPADLSLVSFSGTASQWASEIFDRLIVDNSELSSVAVRILLEQIQSPALPCLTVSLPCRLLSAGTCAPAPETCKRPA